MSAHAVVRARIDAQIKEEATAVLATMGLTVSDAFRILLAHVAREKALPFTLKTPNAETRTAMAEADDIIRTHQARFATAAELFNDLEKNRCQ